MTVGAAALLKAMANRDAVASPIIIVVAHPDDETIGMGAQLCRFGDALLLQVTDGAPRDGRDAAAHGYAGVAEYAFARGLELRAALEAGRAGGVRTEVLGIPDQGACFELISLTRRISQLLRETAPAAIFTQAYEGGHPDHDAAAFAVAAAVRLIAAEGRSPPAILEMTGYHADGPRFVTGTFLAADRPITTIELDAADRRRKQSMIDCFTSQRDLLARFDVKTERFREAPNYDFLQPPHPGELCYETLRWSITGEVWRRQARGAVDELGLHAPPWV
ncbi:MAG: PIG-L family deacetylase [Alphaproteobacteria bacterium]|nr:PIG-L family deacetylase [Alphaproteobacteria bacterium]